jgi:hypothetical protein
MKFIWLTTFLTNNRGIFEEIIKKLDNNYDNSQVKKQELTQKFC